jgi:hypothetical protein
MIDNGAMVFKSCFELESFVKFKVTYSEGNWELYINDVKQICAEVGTEYYNTGEIGESDCKDFCMLDDVTGELVSKTLIIANPIYIGYEDYYTFLMEDISVS